MKQTWINGLMDRGMDEGVHPSGAATRINPLIHQSINPFSR
jgi:hypothetical protein